MVRRGPRGRRSGDQQQATQGPRLANPGRGLRRAATLPAVARCCIDRLNSPVWTLGRVAIVIERVTGVTYGPTQTWTILRTRLGWSRQRPARR
ncbi:helix-turn-helix domain-containing protein, partial [Rhodococcus rhodochrous]|uniref:helix-turn-helix domain-containing protein n=1 Tax=Rhodococcus rhodochrous TaxID=1829 RepID=UPI00355612CD